MCTECTYNLSIHPSMIYLVMDFLIAFYVLWCVYKNVSVNIKQTGPKTTPNYQTHTRVCVCMQPGHHNPIVEQHYFQN